MSDHESRHIPTDAEIREARHAAEAHLNQVGLDDAALWEEPSAGFAAAVIDAIDPSPAAGATVRSSRLWWMVGAAAAVLIAVGVYTMRPAPADWEVALAPTDAAPGVEARVLGWNEASGTRMELVVKGLEPAPNGFVYELWLSDGPVHVSAGTFHNPVDVTLWAGVSRGDFPRLWITLEPLDDDPSPGLNLLDTEA